MNKQISVGYGRVPLIGPLPIKTWNGFADHYRDPVYLTCIAFSDGEGQALFMSGDIVKIDGPCYEKCAALLQKELGIERKSILISATHTHYAPNIFLGSSWEAGFIEASLQVAKAALADLSPARVFGGKGYTDQLTFVRRYLLEDGTWKFNPSAKDHPVSHETEADNELRTLRFAREGKRDILMVNYQTHYHGSVGKNVVTSDVFGDFRALTEKALDCDFIYCSGASGNLNFISAIPGERKHPSIEEAAAELLRTTVETLKGETELETGKLVTATYTHKGKVQKDSPERIAQAEEIHKVGRDSEEGAALVKAYDFVNRYEPGAILERNRMPEYADVNFFVIAFGDVALSSVPYEQFDTNAQEVRAASPYKMTFTLSMTNESYAYIPSALAENHRSYEVAICKFAKGSGTEFAAQQLRLLQECKKA